MKNVGKVEQLINIFVTFKCTDIGKTDAGKTVSHIKRIAPQMTEFCDQNFQQLFH